MHLQSDLAGLLDIVTSIDCIPQIIWLWNQEIYNVNNANSTILSGLVTHAHT